MCYITTKNHDTRRGTSLLFYFILFYFILIHFVLVYSNCASGAAPQQGVTAPKGASDFFFFIIIVIIIIIIIMIIIIVIYLF